MSWPLLRPWLICAVVLLVAYLVLRPSYTPAPTLPKKQVRVVEKTRDAALRAIPADTTRAVRADAQGAADYRAGQAAEARAKTFQPPRHAVKKTPAAPAVLPPVSELERKLSTYGH